MYYLFGKKSINSVDETEELVAIFTSVEKADAYTASCIDPFRMEYYKHSLLGRFGGCEVRLIETDPKPIG